MSQNNFKPKPVFFNLQARKALTLTSTSFEIVCKHLFATLHTLLVTPCSGQRQCVGGNGYWLSCFRSLRIDKQIEL
mgnify:CR=1 FL=1